jgi:S-adenosylmethionine decarboxylase
MENKVYNIEERLDFFFADSKSNLLNYDLSFWEKLLTPAKIKIVSEKRSKDIAAFILSESSLFVLQNRVLVITCGASDVLALTRSMLQNFEHSNFNFLTYQRRGLVPPADKVFENTQKNISEIVKSRFESVTRFEALSLFHKKDKLAFENVPISIQILIFDPDQNRLKSFLQSSSAQRIKAIFANDQGGHLQDFAVDSHDFEPIGYSINAIKALGFYCFHFSPDGPSPYISFELNTFEKVNLELIIHHVLEFFLSKKFEIQIHQFGETQILFDKLKNFNFKSQSLKISNTTMQISVGRNAK